MQQGDARHQFPPAVIQHAVWLYLRFTLSFRDIEDLLADRRVLLAALQPGPGEGELRASRKSCAE